MPSLESLPTEVIQLVFRFIKPSLVFRFRRLSHRYNLILQHRDFARLLVSEHFDSLNSVHVDQYWLHWPSNLQIVYAQVLARAKTSIGYANEDTIDVPVAIPDAIGFFTQLTTINLLRNDLMGSLPSTIGALNQLTNLNLSRNCLSGTLPPELGNLIALTDLGLSYNSFSGPIPPEIGSLVNLDCLLLDNNDLSGAIPAEFGNLVLLTYCDLSNNKLCGPLPSTIKQLSNLEDFLLGENEFDGVQDIPSKQIRKGTRLYNFLEEAMVRVDNSDSEDSDSAGSWQGSDRSSDEN
ncbi:hypothetical protein HDU99_004830 [Rhizoclosmatium hyalinum]|nr:hypothetical protein HDU99_004830 [Rhizoclosmatium hyalinum]